MNNRSLSGKKLDFAFWKRLAAGLMIAVLIVAAAVAAATYYTRQMESRRMLREAKNVRTAARLLKLESYGGGAELLDESRDSGFSETAEQEIRRLTGCRVDFYLLSWDRSHGAPESLLYVENGYMVLVKEKDGGAERYAEELSFQIYRIDKISGG